MTRERWDTQREAFSDGQRWLAGNFDGFGLADLANVFDDGGQISVDVHQSLGSSFTSRRWVTRQGDFWEGQRWLVGDFDGNGLADLANVFDDGGQISVDVHLSTGATFVIERWVTRQGGFWDAQKWVAGDFDGDGRADLASIFDDGSGRIAIDVHRSTGGTFTLERWVTGQGGFWDGQKWVAGDFDGDGRTDLANVFGDQGLISVDVHRSTGGTFTLERWATRQGDFWDAQKWVAGDFDGNGFADLANVFGDEGLVSIDVRRSSGSSFESFQRWVTRQGGFWDGQKWVAGDFDWDGRADLANIFDDQGQVSIDVRRMVDHP